MQLLCDLIFDHYFVALCGTSFINLAKKTILISKIKNVPWRFQGVLLGEGSKKFVTVQTK